MLGLLLGAAVVLVQTPESTYERMALRLVHGPGATGVVQGIQSSPVGGGSFVPGVNLLATADTSVAHLYQDSRAAFQRFSVYGGLSIAGLLATVVFYSRLHHNWEPGWGVGLPVATLGFGWAGAANAAHGEDRLRQAIWLYNRRFLRTPADTAACSYDRCALRIQPHPWSTHLVQGVDDRPLGGLDSRRDLFALAGDSARVHYDAYRALANRTHAARLVGVASYVASAALLLGSKNKVAHGFGVGFLVLGYATAHGTVYSTAAARSELDQAIWFYNRTLGE
jgi:hypothetical protein